jgi:F0F1-type ATP synthase membrane subunit c/vacuolar-type H+-ATPase subunit K
VADIANAICVGACAAKAAETIAVNIDSTKKILAQNLLINEHTEG